MNLSIIIPCYNEIQYISRCIDSLLANDFPVGEMEILIIDGGSTDGTLDIVADYQERYPFIRVINNSKKLKPIALNIGIKASCGDVIMRIDAHSVYDRNYISSLVSGLYDEGVDNIGGVRDTYVYEQGNSLEIALSESISHPFIVGNAYYRTGVLSDKKLVDTVFCGCYRKEVFQKIGLFNEHLIRTQDREFNARLIESGGRILLDPSVHCTYYPRTKLFEYLSWNWKGAMWLGYAKRFTNVEMLSNRNYIPVAFSLYVLLLFIVAIYSSVTGMQSAVLLFLLMPLFVYFTLAFKYAHKLSARYKRMGILLTFPFVAFLTHISYGFALLWGRLCAAVPMCENK